MSSQNQFDSWMRQLERELEEENPFEHLLQNEEELESKTFTAVRAPSRPPSNGNAQIRWVQKALNRVSAFGIAEDGILSVQTRRALQKFQAEHGIKPSGTFGPRTRAALIKASGIMPPRRVAVDDRKQALSEMEIPSASMAARTVLRGMTNSAAPTWQRRSMIRVRSSSERY